MITIDTKYNKQQTFFESLKNEIGGALTTVGKEHIFKINKRLGKGIIRSIDLGDHISFLEFDFSLNEDIKLILQSSLVNTVNFSYCSNGKFAHSFSDGSKKNTLENFQTGIVSNITSQNNALYFERDMHVQASIISVNTEYIDSATLHINHTLKKLFIDDKDADYIYIGSYNLKIAEYIKQLRAVTQEGVVRSLLLKGLINVILALEIEQHKIDLENVKFSQCSLTKTELKLVNELITYINNYPDGDHRLDKLTKKIGLSAAKIQEGFKMTNGQTVCEYIRYVRLSKAVELMATTDMNISEIVYCLGFTSRSYFSKIFKQRFNCAPSHYLKKNKVAVSA